MENLEEKRKALLDRIMTLPEDQRSAICWLIEHRAFAQKLCMAKPLTEQERELYMERAISNDDALMTVLLLLEKRVNVDGIRFAHDEECLDDKNMDMV